jgi:DNA polymerase I
VVPHTVLPQPGEGLRLGALDTAGRPVGAEVLSLEPPEDDGDRWVWPSTAETYPLWLQAGRRIERCHDVELTEALLLGYEGRFGEPRSVAAAQARLVGAPVPADPPARPVGSSGGMRRAGSASVADGMRGPGIAERDQGTLFEVAPVSTSVPSTVGVEDVANVFAAQLARIAATADPARFRLLVAAESAGALSAAEMGYVGLPWSAETHDRVLRGLLGEPSRGGGPPRRLVELTVAISEALGGQRIHPESPAEVVRAFAKVGVSVPNARAWSLQKIEHPAVPLLLEYKELYRIWVAHGWAWLEQWVHDGRFHPEYVPGGVVSGRWATRGGGALQIPRAIRQAVRADPGWTFVVADAGQLEPRILAAVSGDARLAAAAGSGDLYASLADEAFGGDRATAKVALLGAMYGQTGGQAVPALAALRRFYPIAWEYVEEAARTGEAGGLVRSWLGRTCPPTSNAWYDSLVGQVEEDPTRTSAAMRARGRFTRNFVIQATAAEWALVLLARLRSTLAGTPAELVFFQHDEVVVHCPHAQAAEVAQAAYRAGVDAGRLLFGDTPVRFPLDVSTVECYADAK